MNRCVLMNDTSNLLTCVNCDYSILIGCHVICTLEKTKENAVKATKVREIY